MRHRANHGTEKVSAPTIVQYRLVKEMLHNSLKRYDFEMLVALRLQKSYSNACPILTAWEPNLEAWELILGVDFASLGIDFGGLEVNFGLGVFSTTWLLKLAFLLLQHPRL